MNQTWTHVTTEYVSALEKEKAADPKAFQKANGPQRTIDAIRFMQAQITLQAVQ